MSRSVIAESATIAAEKYGSPLSMSRQLFKSQLGLTE